MLKLFVKRFFLISLLYLWGSRDSLLVGQCTTAGPETIPDNDTLFIDFFATGLTDSDLASLTQGICGVEIDFMHEYLGDLTISLVSPSGTIVELIGPVTTATSGTDLTRWDIRFQPCLSPAIPDPGFSAMWSNLQSWNAFTSYSGTYHPESGCLEDFNVGSANGLWSLLIIDHDVFQVGSVASATLIFCNPSGLQCIDCAPNAGTPSPPSITLCESDNLQSSNVLVNFGGAPPDPAFYNYVYVLTDGNNIINYGTSLDVNTTPGLFFLCGLSYLILDDPQVQALLAAGDYDQLLQAIADGAICAAITSQCVIVDVLAIPDTTIIDRNLCPGGCFSFKGQTYCNAGIYFQSQDGPGTCDSVYRIQISQSQLQADINLPDTLDCGSGNLVLTTSVSGNTGPLTYLWTTHDGNIVGPANLSVLTVNEPGLYLLTVMDLQCTAMASEIVISDIGFPQIFLNGGIITCTQPTIDLSPVYVPTDASVVWSGPMGFTSVQPSITVSIPGNYLFTATSGLGCSTTKSIDVGIDTATQAIDIYLLSKNCFSPFATLGNTDNSNIAFWDWSGPNGFTGNQFLTNATDPGIYTLTATFNNGCQRSGTFTFDGDFTVPDLIGSPTDTIHCNEIIPLTIFSATPGVNYNWAGPAGFASTDPMVLVSQHGLYYGTVFAPNGCYSQVSIDIVEGDDIPDFVSYTDTLNCNEDTVEIGVIAADIDIFKWINYNGADSLQSSISVTIPGVYTVMMTDTNTGCIVTTSISVIADLSLPSFYFTVDTITCTNPIAQLSFVPFGGFVYTDVYWRLPDQSIVPGPFLFSDDPGLHELVAVGTNGCAGLWRIRIPFDTIPPTFFLETDTLGCDRQGSILTIPFDPITDILWSGPGMFTSTDLNPFVSDSGTYTATAFTLNGCSKSVSIDVQADFEPPPTFLSLESLGCLLPFAEFIVTTPDSILNYEWKDESGNVIGIDSIIHVTDPGTYTVSLEGSNHCFSADTILLGPAIFPAITTILDTLTCRDTSVTLIAGSDVADPAFKWMDMMGNELSLLSELDVTVTGPFVISVTGMNGCETLDTLIVPIDTIPPIAIIDLIGEVRCQNRDFMLDADSSTPAGLNFSWSSDGGNIIGDHTLALIAASDTGHYFLMVERIDNGCIDDADIHIGEHPDAITLAMLEILRPACSGDSNAQINVTSLVGGIQPVLYQIDGDAPQANPEFQGLTSGSHLLHIVDAEGCEYDTTVVIEPTNPYFVDAGPDLDIYLGESTILSGLSDIDPAEILSEDWDSFGIVLCQGCPEFEVNPWITTTYRFQVTSGTGCVVADDVTVFVIEKGKFYIANIFSPNGDNINDEVRLHGSPGIQKVLKWIIFDRWGDAVFGKTNFDYFDTSVFWDGMTPDGESLNPAVFPYILELVLVNGSKEIHHGTITLIR